MSERPEHPRPRRLAHWINPTGAKKVHSLIDKVYQRKNLEIAWEKVRANKGAGGVDGQSVAAFELQRDEQLDRLHRELRDDVYRPQPVRQVPIPKAGKPGEWRNLGYPRSSIGCASRRCSIGWNRSSSRNSMMPASDTGGGGLPTVPCARYGRKSKAAANGLLTRT